MSASLHGFLTCLAAFFAALAAVVAAILIERASAGELVCLFVPAVIFCVAAMATRKDAKIMKGTKHA